MICSHLLFQEDMSAIYRPILAKAWKTSWHHKGLWILGAVAGVLNTGSVFDIALRTFKQASDVSWQQSLLHGSLPSSATWQVYASQWVLMSEPRRIVTGVLLLLLIVAVLWFATAAQTALIHGIVRTKDRKPDLSLLTLARQPARMHGRVFLIDLVARLAMTLLLLLTSILFLWLHDGSPLGELVANFAVLVLFVPVTLIIGYLSVFSLVETVVNAKSVIASIRAAWQIFRKQWVGICEIAVVLFVISLGVSALLIATILLFTVPYLLIFTAATYTGLSGLWGATIFIGTVLLVLTVIAFFGFLTTFTYATWYHAYERFGKGGVISKLQRFARQLSAARN